MRSGRRAVLIAGGAKKGTAGRAVPWGDMLRELFHCEFCYLVANFDNVETWGYGD